MWALRTILNLILIAIIINCSLYIAYYLYQNSSSDSESFSVMNYNPNLKKHYVNASSEIEQFKPNLRFNHNDISYFINSGCSDDKREKMLEAFSIIQNETEIISFYSENNEVEADILVGCSRDSYEKEKNEFVAGEGGPTKYLDLSSYPIILKGKVLLYRESLCKYPIIELHELFHVFGFDHVNDSSKIMYPYVDCKQRIDPKLISTLIKLYSVEPLPELYFVNVTAVKFGIYLNFSVYTNNYGMRDAEGVVLETYANEKLLDTSDLGEIQLGTGKIFSVSNLRLFSKDTNKIIFKVVTDSKELDENNNIIELSI